MHQPQTKNQTTPLVDLTRSGSFVGPSEVTLLLTVVPPAGNESDSNSVDIGPNTGRAGGLMLSIAHWSVSSGWRLDTEDRTDQ